MKYRALTLGLAIASGLPLVQACATNVNTSGLIVQSDAEANLPADAAPEAAPKKPKDAGKSAVVDTPETGPTCTLHQSFQPGTCDSCLQANCCQEMNTCFDDASCTSLTNCETVCLDDLDPDTCAAGCEAQYPSKVQDFNAWVQCGSQACTNDCQ